MKFGIGNNRFAYPALIVVLCGVAAFLRIRVLTAESFWLDEVFSVEFVRDQSVLGLFRASFAADYHPFFYYILLDLWTTVFGASDGACRMLSVIIGIAVIPAVALLGRTVFNSRIVGALCALLVTLSPVHLQFSLETRMYGLLMLLCTLLLYFGFRCAHTGMAVKPAIGFVLCFELLAYSHGSAGLLVLPALVPGLLLPALVHAKDRGKSLARAGSVGVACILFYIPWLVRAAILRSDAKALQTFGLLDAGPFLVWLFASWSTIAAETTIGIVVLVSLCALWAVRRSVSKAELRRAGTLVLVIVTVLITQALLAWIKPSYQPRNLVFLLPPVLLLFSWVCFAVFRYARSTSGRLQQVLGFGLALTLYLTVLIFSGVYTLDRINNGFSKEPWREAVAYVRPKLRDGDVLAFYANYVERCWTHYYRYASPPLENAPSIVTIGVSQGELEATTGRTKKLIEITKSLPPRNSIWVFYSHVPDPAPFERLVTVYGLRERDEWRGPQLILKRYARSPRPMPARRTPSQ